MLIEHQAFAALTAAAAIGGIVSWTVATLLSKLCPRLGMSSYFLATLAAPAATITAGAILFKLDTSRHPTTDLPAMAFAGYIGMAGLMLLVAAPVAFVTLRRSSPRKKSGRSS